MILGKVKKQPIEKIDFDVDYSDYFTAGQDADSILSATASATRTKTGSTVAAASMALTTSIIGQVVRVLVSGGLDGEEYKIQVNMTGQAAYGSRVIQDELIVAIKEV